jgi:tRNA/tmRNA/rRNA uracil-C5-methylase (TrmA/RlmC/RlmD family)
MKSLVELKTGFKKTEALCPVFGECGGCLFQDIAYADELVVKEDWLKELLETEFPGKILPVQPIVGSPIEYYYRHRLDLKLTRFKNGQIELGFSPAHRNRIIPVQECFIAKKEVSAAIPQLKQDAAQKLPLQDRNANVVVRCGDEGRVCWGGIGKRSLRQTPEDYFWTDVNGRRVFFSLETFFQANLSILPNLMNVLRSFPVWSHEKIFLDLYGGVGLFGLNVHDLVKTVYLIEENKPSVMLAQYNADYHQLKNFQLVEGRMEDRFDALLEMIEGNNHIMMVDPPRAGLSEAVLKTICEVKKIKHLIYLSCNPESLVRDLKECLMQGWSIQSLTPFDFFPRTKHLEVLVLLEKGNI